MKINTENCYVDKRKLIFDCDLDIYNLEKNRVETKNFIFEYNGWGDEDVFSLKINGKNSSEFAIITSYKHCIQAHFDGDDDAKVFIDRRYCHNHEFDVYYQGKHYLVNCK